MKEKASRHLWLKQSLLWSASSVGSVKSVENLMIIRSNIFTYSLISHEIWESVKQLASRCLCAYTGNWCATFWFATSGVVVFFCKLSVAMPQNYVSTSVRPPYVYVVYASPATWWNIANENVSSCVQPGLAVFQTATWDTMELL